MANVCANARGGVSLDSYPVDIEAGVAIGTALATNCMPAVTIDQVVQSSTGFLDPGTGRPISGPGDTFVAGGGAFGQRGVAYMEKALSPIFLTSDGTTGQIRNRAANTAIVTTPVNLLTEHHDYFYVQLMVEPVSGTLCFSGVGMLGPGTQAVGFFTAAELVPNRSKYTASWYVYEWTDSNNDSVANAGDMFTQVASGM